MKKTPEKEIMFEFKRLYKEAIRNELSDESASFADVIQDKAEPYISRSSTGGAVAAKKVRKKNQYGNEGIKKRHK